MLSCALLALFLAALEQTILGPAMADIVAELGGGPLLPWVATAYLMAATAAAPILGALADIHGRRRVLLSSVGLFIAGSVLGALADTLPVLVAARAVQGAGAGGLFALPFVVITDLVPPQRRAIFAAGISTIYAVASILGPLAGGGLVDALHWSAVFWINLPIGAVVVTGVLIAGPMGGKRHDRRVDLPGAALIVATSFAAVLALDRAAAGDVRDILQALGLAVVAALCFAGFGRRMMRAPDPLVPLSVLTDRTILLVALVLFCCQGANVGLALYLPLYWRTEYGMTATESGLAVLGLLIGVIVGPYLSPRLLLRNPRYRPVMVAGAALATAGAAGLTLAIALGASILVVEFASATLGFGIGILYPVVLLAVQNAARPETAGAAMGILAFMRAIGATLGVSAVGIAAIATGIDGGTGAGWPTWTLFVPGLVMMALCLGACLALPDRALSGYAVKKDAPAAPPAGE